MPLWLDFCEGHSLHFQTMQSFLDGFLQSPIGALQEDLLQEQSAASQGNICQGFHKGERFTPTRGRPGSAQHGQGEISVLYAQFAGYIKL
jgi:hypothetical protein